MNKKRGISIILAIVLLFSLAACTNGSASTNKGETKTITDCMGREVNVPEDPERVAVLYASIAHMVAMLDEGSKIVATPKGVKSDELMLMKYPEIADTATPYQEGVINIEELVEIDADLLLVRYSTAQNEGETEKLDKLGIPYAVVDYVNIDELKKAIIVMGEIFNKEERAEKYNSFFDETIQLVENNLESIDKSDHPEVYHSVNEAIRTNTDSDISTEIMNLAGVKSASEGKKLLTEKGDYYTTLEEIYKWDPFAIIANEYSVKDYILSDSKWTGLTAVKNKKVYTLPVGATRWCHPGSMEAHMGVLSIAKIFHPKEMEDVDLNKYVKDYYAEYFDLDLDDNMTKKILSGEGLRKSNSPVK